MNMHSDAGCNDPMCASCNVGKLTGSERKQILQGIDFAKTGNGFVIAMMGNPNDCKIITNVSPAFFAAVIANLHSNNQHLDAKSFSAGGGGIALHEPSIQAAFAAMKQPVDEDLPDDAKHLLQTMRCLTAYFNHLLLVEDGVTLQ